MPPPLGPGVIAPDTDLVSVSRPDSKVFVIVTVGAVSVVLGSGTTITAALPDPWLGLEPPLTVSSHTKQVAPTGWNGSVKVWNASIVNAPDEISAPATRQLYCMS